MVADDKPILNQGEELMVEKIASRVVESYQSKCPAVSHVVEMVNELKKLNVAVCGNGEPEKSLLARMAVQERTVTTMVRKRNLWFDRTWKIAMSVAMAIFGWHLSSGGK